MIYSYSSLNLYNTCPQQFYRKYRAKDMLPYVGKEAAAGTDVHEAIEHALKTRSPLPTHLEVFEESISSVRSKINCARIEQVIYLDEAFRFSVTRPERGFVAKLDVLLISEDGTRAVVMDWKTGKPREDTLQHDCYALAVMRAFPQVKVLTGFNVYLSTGKVGPQLEYSREAANGIQQRIATMIARIEADEFWQPNPGKPFPCNWCAAHKCKHYPKEK